MIRILWLQIFAMPGWLGVRSVWGGRYVYLRDVKRHWLLYSERNRRGCKRLASHGSWELWVRG